MRFELYKIFRKKVVLVLICAGLLFGLFSVLQPVLQYTTYTEQMEKLVGLKAIQYDRDLQNIYAGRYTLEEITALYTEKEAIYNNPSYQRSTNKENTHSFSGNSGNTTPLTDEAYYKYLNRYGIISTVGARTFHNPLYVSDLRDTGDLSEFYFYSIVQNPAEESLVPSPDPLNPIVQKLLGLYDNLQYPLYGEYVYGWQDFFNSIPVFFQWIVGLIIVIGIVPVFAEESSSGSDKVLLTTRHGKTRMIRNKIAAGILYASFIFLLFALYFIILYISIYGTSGLKASIQLLAHCKLSPYNLSIAQAIMGWLILGWGSSLVIASSTMLFSALSPNTFIAFIPSFISYIVPMMSFAGVSPWLHRIMQLFPVNTIGAIDRFFSMSDFYTLFNFLIEKKSLFAAVGIVAITMCSLLSAEIFRKKKISN